MKTTVGSNLKRYRLSKNISLAKLGGETLSRSFLSRVENDESGISIESLFYLLDRLHVTMTEFVQDSEIISYSHFVNEYNKISIAYRHTDFETIENIRKHELIAFNASGLIEHQHLALIAEALLAELRNKKLNPQSLSILEHYLFVTPNLYSSKTFLLQSHCPRR
jgi:transcriptional regulator with XRE-family HTH domain